MQTVTDSAGLAPFHGGVFVPTMGALHAGHAALIRRAASIAASARLKVVVSIFVNPTQFNDPADFARYPRTIDADAAIARDCAADCLFVPAPEVVYPPGSTIPVPPLPAVGAEPGLEDAHRPGHFAGVCQVCYRLFDLVRPSVAIFGEKDWQQLQVVSTMVESLGMPMRIVSHETLREPGGLAMSSRNARLSPAERVRALAISRSLVAAGREPTPAAAEAAASRVLADAGITPDYAVVREAASLGPLRPTGHAWPPARILIAARVGQVRLIDNAPWPGFEIPQPA